jgi:hypothetical protein
MADGRGKMYGCRESEGRYRSPDRSNRSKENGERIWALMGAIFPGSSVVFTDDVGLPLDFKITNTFVMTFNYIFNQYRICTMEFVSSLIT